MPENMSMLRSMPLFNDITAEDISKILRCSGSDMVKYHPGEYIFHTDTIVRRIGILMTGSAHIISEDYWGNKFILRDISAGELFGAVHALTPGAPTLFSMVAQSPVSVIYIRMDCITHPCEKSCPCHMQLIQNLLGLVAKENMTYLRKFEHLSRRTTREKLLSYFSEQARVHRSSSFDIPFNRQQLADYLTVDRSAMSTELGRMAADGLIRFDRNHFELIHG